MAVFRCKMCGSDLYPEDGAKTVYCDICGSEQTLPKAADEHKTELFNRANGFRMQRRFDEALKLYGQILAEYPDEADSHWGKVLCEYGIEYVDDARTERKIPTCNRTLSISIFDHPEYKAAIAKATATNSIVVSPIPANQSAYSDAGILCTAQATGSITFVCDSVPATDIQVNVLVVD